VQGQMRLESNLNKAGNKVDVLCPAEIETAVGWSISVESNDFVPIKPG